MERRKIEQKYREKVKESFRIKVDAFLFKKIIDGGALTGVGDNDHTEFHAFDLNTDAIGAIYDVAVTKEAEEAVESRPALTYSDVDREILEWKKRNGWGKAWWAEYRDSFAFKPGENPQQSINAFVAFYGEDANTRKCSYCGIVDSKVATLRERGRIKTKRGRGKNMEIDRHNSNREYFYTNVRLACYWCNNAKTDEFTPQEFGGIGAAIRAVWNERLAEANLPLIE